MATLHEGDVEAEYGLVWLMPPEQDPPVPTDAVGGQRNGLCGGAVPGVLLLHTSTTRGHVPMRVDLHTGRPPLDPAWEEVVEASFVTDVTDHVLWSFQEVVALPPLPSGAYRARLSATGYDDAYDGTRVRGGPVVDRYLLELWPAPPAPDAVLRCTGTRAADCHRLAQATPPVGEEGSPGRPRAAD